MGLAAILFVLYVYPGFLSPVPSHFDGTCRTLPMSAGAEDLRIDPTNGLAYLSYFEHAGRGPRSLGTGTVMLVDLNTAEPRVRAALATEPAHFTPSGLSLYAPSSGPKRLFVVNRAELGTHGVEIFDQSATGAFAPVETVRDPLFWSPTAIVAVGPKQFYVVNDAGFKEDFDASDPRKYVAQKLRGNRGTVVYFDGKSGRIVADRLGVPTGVAVSPDGRTLYVVESGDGRIQLLDRDPTSGALTSTRRIRIGDTPHNITVDTDGSLWITVHSLGSSFVQGIGDAASTFPTRVVKVVPSVSGDSDISDVYVNGGSELSGGTIAAPRGNQLVIGSATDHKLLLCTRGAPSGSASPLPAISGPEKED